MSENSTTDFDALASIRHKVPGRCGGQPVFPGSRIQPKDVLAQYKIGKSVDYVLDAYPQLSREQIEDCIRIQA